MSTFVETVGCGRSVSGWISGNSRCSANREPVHQDETAEGFSQFPHPHNVGHYLNYDHHIPVTSGTIVLVELKYLAYSIKTAATLIGISIALASVDESIRRENQGPELLCFRQTD